MVSSGATDGGKRMPVLAIAVLAGLVTASCASDADAVEQTFRDQPEPVGSTSESSPFQVGRPPEGYRPVQAGQGTNPQHWGDDIHGTDRPVTVLAPVGQGPGGPDQVQVELTGFEGYQGGLEQILGAGLEEFELAGGRAFYSPALPGIEEGSVPQPARLVVEVGDDLAVLVSAADASQDELAEIAQAVEPQDDHMLAPLVPDPPGDLEVVGFADADVIPSLQDQPAPATASLPAGERAHTMVWARGTDADPWTSDDTVVVTTLPGAALALDALPALLLNGPPEGEPDTVADAEVDGRPAAVIELMSDDDGGARPDLSAVVTSTREGDLLLVKAHGPAPPDIDELVSVAASVEAVDVQTWSDLVLEAQGGPGLRPDPGAVELERGTIDGVEWLFQARIDTDGDIYSWPHEEGEDVTTGQYVADPQLKLSTGERVGYANGSGDSDFLVIVNDLSHLADPPVASFVIVMTTADAATAWIDGDDGHRHQAAMHLLPGGNRRAGIFMDVEPAIGFSTECVSPDDPPEWGASGVELLDDALQPVDCPA